jgi:four helix bundle protein
MAVQHYRQLIVWQKAMELVKLVYELTAKFPKEELYGLIGQMRRASIAIPSNIAEGQRRNSTKDFLRFLSIANGSLAELETQTLVSEMLNYLTSEETKLLLEKCAEVGKLLNGLINSLEKKLNSNH